MRLVAPTDRVSLEAKVVIGGVITSTLFTLFVLPALYRLVLAVPPALVLPGSRD